MHKIPAGLPAAINTHIAMERSTLWSTLSSDMHEDSLPHPCSVSNGLWHPAVSLS